jgi:hypothetical protein
VLVRQAPAHLPKAVAERTALRHVDRPLKLHAHQILADPLPVLVR